MYCTCTLHLINSDNAKLTAYKQTCQTIRAGKFSQSWEEKWRKTYKAISNSLIHLYIFFYLTNWLCISNSWQFLSMTILCWMKFKHLYLVVSGWWEYQETYRPPPPSPAASSVVSWPSLPASGYWCSPSSPSHGAPSPLDLHTHANIVTPASNINN